MNGRGTNLVLWLLACSFLTPLPVWAQNNSPPPSNPSEKETRAEAEATFGDGHDNEIPVAGEAQQETENRTPDGISPTAEGREPALSPSQASPEGNKKEPPSIAAPIKNFRFLFGAYLVFFLVLLAYLLVMGSRQKKLAAEVQHLQNSLGVSSD